MGDGCGFGVGVWNVCRCGVCDWVCGGDLGLGCVGWGMGVLCVFQNQGGGWGVWGCVCGLLVEVDGGVFVYIVAAVGFVVSLLAVGFAHCFLGVRMFRPTSKKRVRPLVPNRLRRSLHVLLLICALPGE